MDAFPGCREFLASTDVVDWYHPDVQTAAWFLAGGESDPVKVAKRCFEWVRDEIQHCMDFRRTEVTCRASEVLTHGTGFCYAKSHLLAAVLRANGIPAGFCYQRLSIDGAGRAVLPARTQCHLVGRSRLVSRGRSRQQSGRLCRVRSAARAACFCHATSR